MQWYTDLKNWKKPLGPLTMTIGNFDGVHLGHQALIRRIVEGVQRQAGSSLLLTFSPHPGKVLRPEGNYTALYDQEDKRKFLEATGLDGVFEQSFSRDFSQLSAAQFLDDFLWTHFSPTLLVVGPNFAFGSGRTGTLEVLSDFCRQKNIEFHVQSPVKVQDEIVSTSAIKAALSAGQVRKAETFLGKRYQLKGLVMRGEQRGRALGFPTANLRLATDFSPKPGVYVCEVQVQGKTLPAVMNIGINKTFREGDMHPLKTEVHVLDFSGDLYGRTLRVQLLSYLREEKKFSSVEELKSQIAADVQAVKAQWSGAHD